MNSQEQQISQLQTIQSQIDTKVREIDSNAFLDGILNIEKYVQSDVKILWILKEPNSEERAVNWREYILDLNDGSGNLGGFAKTFTKLIYTTYGILNKKKWKQIDWIYNDPEVVSALEQIAFININKTPAGSESADSKLSKQYDLYKDVVIEQINSFQPNVIIGGHTFKYMHNDLQLIFPDLEYHTYVETSDLGIRKSKACEVIVFDAYHPGCRITNEAYCNDIIENFLALT